MPAKKTVRKKKASTPVTEVKKVAREQFGYEDLRPGQDEAIQSILARRDTLVVQPTGAGKSAIYQLSGLFIDGPTIVVSPLIALQKDQLEAIREQDVADAGVVNSVQRVGELRETFGKLEGGRIEYLFLSPEQLQKPETLERLKEATPSLFVVDEAHCISEWGHDFRPDYLKIGPAIEALGHPVVLAMTATAAPAVREEIVERLGMRDPRVIVRGFDRPNIHLSVRAFGTEREKFDALLDAVEEAEKPGIVYVATRKHAEDIAGALTDRGVNVVHYHGGMPAKERDRIQNEYMAGGADVIVATNAFGMGVDKANVRFVFHADISDSIDSYYQEIGRAGRDGQPSQAVLFYRPEDLHLQKFFKGGGKVEESQIRHVAEVVQNADAPIDTEELQKSTDLSERKVAKAVARLKEVGAVEALPTGELVPAEDAPPLDEAAKKAAEQQEKHKEYERLRLEKMQAYAELLCCRREYILQYFGEEAPAHCAHCDNCCEPRERAQPPRPAVTSTKTAKPKPVAAANRPFAPNTRVVHKEWGRGVVEENDDEKIVVLFDQADVGRKTLALHFVQEKNILEPVA